MKQCLVVCIILLFITLFPAGSEVSGRDRAADGKKTARSIPDPLKELTPACLACFGEALRLVRNHGGLIWKGFNQINVRANIITPHYEFFFGDQNAPSGYYLLAENNPVLGKPVFYRKREYRHEFVSTVEKIEGRPALFISSKEVFEKTYSRSPLYKIAEDYIFTIIQKCFHLYLMNNDAQFSQKISGSGETPAFLLSLRNRYPYLDYVNASVLDLEGRTLLDALNTKNGEEMKEHTLNFLRLRKMRDRQMKDDFGMDCRAYENWLEWYEGLARYTEVRMAEYISSGHYKPGKAICSVSNFSRYSFVRNKTAFELTRLKSTRNSLIHSAMGLTEALVLDRFGGQWKEKIFEPAVFPLDLLWENFRKDSFPHALPRQD